MITKALPIPVVMPFFYITGHQALSLPFICVSSEPKSMLACDLGECLRIFFALFKWAFYIVFPFIHCYNKIIGFYNKKNME